MREVWVIEQLIARRFHSRMDCLNGHILRINYALIAEYD